MKFLLLFLFLFVNTHLLSAQSSVKKQNPISITGFGKLQLGMNISDIPELSNPKNSFNIKEIMADTLNLYSEKDLDKRVRMFIIEKFPLTDNITVNKVTLNFFENKLYSIDIKDRKMIDLINSKYGSGKFELSEKDNTFQNGYGAKFIKTDKTYKINWIVDKPNVSLNSTLLIWHNEKGEKLDLYYTILKDSKYDLAIKKGNEIIKKRIEKRENDKKKVELKDF